MGIVEFEKRVEPDDILKCHPTNQLSSKIIVIGASTGGVETLSKIFSNLNSNCAPIAVVQHIPQGFSLDFANRLNGISKVKTKEAATGDILERGCAYIAPGNFHLTIESKNMLPVIKLQDWSKVSRHKPSVDILFRSASNLYVGSSVLGIILTGMGDDGSIGMKDLYDNGASTIAQSEDSCVVFGMPKRAIENHSIKKILNLEEIASAINAF